MESGVISEGIVVNAWTMLSVFPFVFPLMGNEEITNTNTSIVNEGSSEYIPDFNSYFRINIYILFLDWSSIS